MEDPSIMRNYLVIALCIITLFAVSMDVLLLDPRSVKAAGSTVVKIQSVATGNPTPISGQIVGFSCISSGECLIATRETR